MRTSLAEIRRIIMRCCAATQAIRSELEALDGAAGDGDLGISMNKAAEALRQAMEDYAGADLGEMLLKGAMAVNGAAPSTMGTLIARGLMKAGKAQKGRRELEDSQIIESLAAIAQGIQEAGGARPGDRTILDALCPMNEALESEYRSTGRLDWAAAARAARQGAEATSNMQPRAGRARWNPQNARGVPDGGAVLCARIVETLTQDV